MASWTYRCYVDEKEPCLWQAWYNANANAQGAHDAVFDIIEQLEFWREPHTKAFDELVEVRFKAAGRQHRVFGFYGSVKQQFVIVGFGYHKGNVYTPKEILKTCTKRRSEIERDPNKARDCNRPEAQEVSEEELS